jgi:hypothetical protein
MGYLSINGLRLSTLRVGAPRVMTHSTTERLSPARTRKNTRLDAGNQVYRELIPMALLI